MEPEEFDIERGLQQTFHEASMHYALNVLNRSEDFAQANDIITKGEAERDDLNQTYIQEFDNRIDVERLRLINEAGSLTHEHPAPFGVDRFNHANITERARNLVVNDHEGALQQSYDSQQGKMDDLMGQARNRDSRQGDVTQEFNRMEERRDGKERRSPSRSR